MVQNSFGTWIKIPSQDKSFVDSRNKGSITNMVGFLDRDNSYRWHVSTKSQEYLTNICYSPIIKNDFGINNNTDGVGGQVYLVDFLLLMWHKASIAKSFYY